MKNTKSLLTKLLLMMVLLTFSGCEMFQYGFNRTINIPSEPTPDEPAPDEPAPDSLVGLIGGLTEVTLYTDRLTIIEISDDAKTLSINERGDVLEGFKYTEGGDDWGKYIHIDTSVTNTLLLQNLVLVGDTLTGEYTHTMIFPNGDSLINSAYGQGTFTHTKDQ